MTNVASALTRVLQSSKSKLLRFGLAGLVCAGALWNASGAHAASSGITSVTIQNSSPAFGGCSIPGVGTFTLVQGFAQDAIDPANPLNSLITDIGLAPKDANGMVNLIFNFAIVLPSNLANFSGRVVADIPNRSGSTLAQPNEASSPAQSPNNCNGTFWYTQGWATLDVGWEQDGGGDPTAPQPLNGNTSFAATGANSTGTSAGTIPTMPVATNGGTTITGPGYEYIVTGSGLFNLGGGVTFPNYPAASSNANMLGGPCSTSSASNVLTHRKHLDDTPAVLPSAGWQFNIGTDGNCDSISLTAAAGAGNFNVCTVGPTCPTGAAFVNPDIYELSYTAANPTVNGAGHAIIRDFLSWLKGNSGTASQSLNPFAANGVNTITQMYSWTSSQPARTLNDYIHLGFNGDINGKRVIDGMVNWIGAGAGISMNYRWSHTTETERNRQQHLWVESFFPFADATTFDPISGTTDGRYAKCTANNTCPLMNFLQYSANEYWVKTASLLHTDPTGTIDLPDATHPLSRYYYMSSLQHGGGTQNSRLTTGACQNFNNPVDAEYTERALWRALDQYVVGHIPAPPSQVPTLAGGTLVTPQQLNFPSGYLHTVTGINGGNPFPMLYTGLETTRYRFNMGPNFYSSTTNGQGAPGSPVMIPTINPPVNSQPFENNRANGSIYPSFVPKTNSDGNDVTGVMMPEIQVPLATYFGWNYRSGGSNAPTPDNDGPDGCESTGGYVQFAATPAQANANGDPRPAITTRYPTYANYLNQVVNATDKLIWNRFLLCGNDTSPTSNVVSGTLGSSVVANLVQDWTSIAGLPPTNGLKPPNPLPACNNALTHNFSGSSGGNGSSVLWRDTGGNVGLWLVNGSTIAQSSVLGNVPTMWSIVGQRDINGDGNADIIWRDTQGNVGVWLMNGTQVMSSSVLGNIPTNWSVAGTIGFNTGGYGSIIWRDNQGNVGIWFMNGTTVVSTAIVGNMPTSYVIAGSDLQGDIFWRNVSTGDVQMWQMYGTLMNKSVDLGIVPLNWNLAGIGDFDGNGSTDLLWRDGLGNVGIWFMNGTSVMSASVLGLVPLNWTIAHTGDYNGDGKSDILWTDGSGNVAAWLMNGSTVAQVLQYGNVGSSWMVQAMNSE